MKKQFLFESVQLLDDVPGGKNYGKQKTCFVLFFKKQLLGL